MYNNILIPVDTANTEPVGNMLDVARKLLNENGQIHLLNVVEEMPEYVTAELPTNFFKQGHIKAEAALQEIARAHDLNAKVHISHGHAATKILEFSNENACDVIIIGSHKPEMMDYLLGSTAARVVRKSKSSVHVVR